MGDKIIDNKMSELKLRISINSIPSWVRGKE